MEARQMEIKAKVKKKHEEQGFVLMVALIVMVFLLLLAAPFLFQLSNDSRLTSKNCKSSLALSLAEAGIERTIWELNYGDISGWDGDSSERTLTISDFQTATGDVVGDIEISITDPEGDNPIIESNGRVAFGSSQIQTRIVQVGLGGFPAFSFGAFGNDGMYIDRQITLDSYDSRNGAYGGVNIGSEAYIGTNSTLSGGIWIDADSEIKGSVFSGYDSDPDQVVITDGSATIYGEKRSLHSAFVLPSVITPIGLPYRGDYSLDDNNLDTINVSGEYGSFSLGKNSTLRIEGDVILFITSDFYMDKNSVLEIASDASLTIYLGAGDFEMDAGAAMNNLSLDPSKLLVYGTGSFNGEIYMDQNTTFYGAIYASQGNVRLDASSGFYGAAVAKNVMIDVGAVIHYDKSLENLDILPSMGAFYEVKSWQEKK
jgi:Tfp pilus assembly protein FimT